MNELGPLFEPIHEPDLFWILIVIFSLPGIAVALYVMFRGALPRTLGTTSAVLLVPVFAYVLGNVHVLEKSKRVEFCGSCHVTMPPLVESMKMPGNELAAGHYRVGAVSRENACYQCHSGYGLTGGVRAKADGISHMIHTILSTERYPLRMRRVFDIKSCLDCHAETPAFQAVKGHLKLGIQQELVSGAIGCGGSCHEAAHPPAALNGTARWERWKKEQDL